MSNASTFAQLLVSGSPLLSSALWDGVTNTYSNTTPAVDTNPSDTGALWFDSTTGTLYVCTDNTEDENVWAATSTLGENVAPAPPYSFQGSNYGYTAAGAGTSGSTATIEKFSFTSDGNATSVGNLSNVIWATSGQSSAENGYNSGGDGSATVSTIDKFSFATDGDATSAGDLSSTRRHLKGHSSANNGYTSGGMDQNVIDKFPFASDGNATNVGSLTFGKWGHNTQSSSDYGYGSGGRDWANSHVTVNIIDKFPFATDANATDVGDITVTRYYPTGQSSTDYGYTSGGYTGSAFSNVIDKFPFASDANATDVGDLLIAKSSMSGQSSTTHGYSTGGDSGPSLVDITKFSFTSDGNATDVGDLSVARRIGSGQQY